ncbi:hypothetical protein PQX77_019508 [Marasmius sp. AFHP31]|nr:hypothetical protein PQX77_019508 [Marasmius sp. AFHP31]
MSYNPVRANLYQMSQLNLLIGLLNPQVTFNASVLQHVVFPHEILVEIFYLVVQDTGSSTSLFAILHTCTDFRNIVIGEPKLWAYLRADFETINFATPTQPLNPVTLWPLLYAMLPLSGERPFNLSIDLVARNLDSYEYLHNITLAHLHTLVVNFLWTNDAFRRCREIVVNCTRWEDIVDIMLPLAHEFDELSGLKGVDFRWTPWIGFNSALHPANENPIPTPLDGPSDLSNTLARYRYGSSHLPQLKHVTLDGIPFGWDTICASNLTTLRLVNLAGPSFQPAHRDLRRVLVMSSETLTTLELGWWGLPYTTAQEPRSLTLPALRELKFFVRNYYDFHGFAKVLRLPSLTKLSFYDHLKGLFPSMFDVHDMAQQEMGAKMRICSDAYGMMAENWSLNRVTELEIINAVFYETANNRVSLLEQSRRKQETWEPHGIPIASRFFGCFSSLMLLRLPGADETAVTAAKFAPRRWNAETGEFDYPLGDFNLPLAIVEGSFTVTYA